ncbi:hypothetical protein J6590_041772 [Homalodisca vitripennis]|nr:hypothetical protein J6590_041772 [Homalodisca vitripennis]
MRLDTIFTVVFLPSERYWKTKSVVCDRVGRGRGLGLGDKDCSSPRPPPERPRPGRRKSGVPAAQARSRDLRSCLVSVSVHNTCRFRYWCGAMTWGYCHSPAAIRYSHNVTGRLRIIVPSFLEN